MKHVDAKDVFPSELVKEIQKHYSGGYIFIPKPGYKRRKKISTEGKVKKV